MEELSPLLSICIPTYNGASSCLDLVLDAAIAVANKYKEIEIIVSDNCSKDKTKELVLSYQSQYPALRYHRNSDNLGFNGNMLGLVKMAKGKYAWLIGDDDIINLSTFEVIYQTLRKDEIDYISVGFKMAFKEDFRQENFVENASLICGTYSDVLKNNCYRGNTLATFMGSSIVRLSMFRAVPTDMIEPKFDCYYNCFPNAYIVATAFHNAKCAYIKEPCIICVSAKDHKKGYENLNSWEVIDTKAIVELFDYVQSLGIKKEFLKETEERIIFDNVITRTKLLIKGNVSTNIYLKYIVKSLYHPRVTIALLKKVTNIVIKTNMTIDI